MKRTLFKKSRDIVNMEGYWAFIERCAWKACSMVFQTNDAIWYKKELDGTVPEERAGAEIRVVFSSGGEIIRWLRDMSGDYPWIYLEREIRTAGRENHLFLFAATEAGKIIGYAKIGFHRVYVHDFKREITLPSRDAMIYDTFVLPEHRGRNIALTLVNEAVAYLRTRRYKRVWCHIPEWNKASRALYRKEGFTEVSRIKFVRLMAFKFFNLTPEKMFSGFSS